MKRKLKFILPCLIIFILMGCDLNNTPTSKVEERLSKYQMIDKDININEKILFLTDSDELDDEQISEYRKILESQYKNMAYNVKDETVDGETAIVEVQIEVVDFKKVIEELNSEVNQDEVETDVYQYNEMKIERLNKAKDKVTYTIEFRVNKDNDGNWVLDNLDSIEEQKLLGIY